MALRKRQPEPGPQPCPCAGRIDEAEATLGAIARAVAVLRPRAAGHSIEVGLTGYGVDPADARLIAEACRQWGA